MAELDPYATLGVARTATRTEVARAYRALAKRWHPDTASTPAERDAHVASMARVNQAWHILSNAARRAQWDAAHPLGGVPHWGAAAARQSPWATPAAQTWTPPVAERVHRAPPRATLRDSGWLAVGVTLIAAAVISGVMIAVTWGSVPRYPWGDEAAIFSSDDMAMNHPPDWAAFTGTSDASAPSTVVVHLVSDREIDAADACTDSAVECDLTLGGLPPGEISLVISRWEGGTPIVPEPVRRLPSGLYARVLGDIPVAFRLQNHADGAAAWWQLSPPDFPARWYEAYAWIAGSPEEEGEAIEVIESMLSTVVFFEDS